MPCLEPLQRGSRPREEEADGLLLDERRHGVLALGGQAQDLAAGEEQPQVAAALQQLAQQRRGVGHLLEVVEHEQHPPVAT
jgi:hypothetical protein